MPALSLGVGGTQLAPQRSRLHGICLHGIFMAGIGFCMRPSCPASQDAGMDVVSIVLGLLMFAILFALIYGIDAI